MCRGDPRLEVHDLGRGGGAVLEAGELEHGGNVCRVARANIRRHLVVREVVLAVGQPETVLPGIDHVALGVPEILVLVDADRDRVAAAVRCSKVHGEVIVIPDRLDTLELGAEGHNALRVAGLHVHVGPVKVADLLFVRAHRKFTGSRFFDYDPDVLLGLVGENRESVIARLVGGDLGVGDPRAIHIGEEIVARTDGRVHVLQRDAGVPVDRSARPGHRYFLLAAGRQRRGRGGRQ